MKLKMFSAVFLLTLLMACASPAAETAVIQETVEVPVTVEVTRVVETQFEVTRLVETEVEVTRIVEVTPLPTETPTPEPVAEGDDIIALNYVAEAQSGGVTVEIARVLVANKEAIPQDFSMDSSFDNIDVVGEVIFIVRNETENAVNLYPFQGTVQINSEVIELFDYFLARFGDNIGSEIPPGAELIAGQWFGINRNNLDEITEMIVRFNAPSDAESFQSLGEDFEFTIDLTERVFEPIPEELQDALN